MDVAFVVLVDGNPHEMVYDQNANPALDSVPNTSENEYIYAHSIHPQPVNNRHQDVGWDETVSPALNNDSQISDRQYIVPSHAQPEDERVSSGDDIRPTSVSIETGDYLNVPKSEPTPRKASRTGKRSPSEIWTWLTDEMNPHNGTSCKCKHCNQTVTHRRKVECAKRHLEHCDMFEQRMMSVDVKDRPEWYMPTNKKAKITPPSKGPRKSISRYNAVDNGDHSRFAKQHGIQTVSHETSCILDTSERDGNASEETEHHSEVSSRRPTYPTHTKNGRTRSLIWQWITDDANPHQAISCRCKHCHLTVMHHKKSERVRSHLEKCEAFKCHMMNVHVKYRPEWLDPKSTKDKQTDAQSNKSEKAVLNTDHDVGHGDHERSGHAHPDKSCDAIDWDQTGSPALCNSQTSNIDASPNDEQCVVSSGGDHKSGPTSLQNECKASKSKSTLCKHGKHGGRKQSEIWPWCTDDLNPHLAKSCKCKHCHRIVMHHRKSEFAKRHLSKCEAFREKMMAVAVKDRPEWYVPIIKKPKFTSPPAGLASWKSILGFDPVGSRSASSTKRTSKLSKMKVNQIHEHLAMHCYITGSPFSRIEEPNLSRAFKLCCPDVELPDSKKLAGALLDRCHAKTKDRVDAFLDTPLNYVCVMSDATWSNVKQEPIVTYMAVSSKHSLFLETVASGERGQNAEWVAEDLTRVIKSMKCKVAGAVTDNTSTNQLARVLLKANHPSLFFHGCCFHCLHLLVEDIFAATGAFGGRYVADYPPDFPFAYLHRFASDCKSVAAFFHNDRQAKARLAEAQQEEAKVKGCALPAVTCSASSLKDCFDSLLASEKIIYSIVSEVDFVTDTSTSKQKWEREEVREIVNKDTHVYLLHKSLAILEPIHALITAFQTDVVPPSEVYHAFRHVLPDQMKDIDDLQANELDYLLRLIDERFQFMYGDAFGMGHLLDPRFVGESMSLSERRQIEDLIYRFPADDGDVHGDGDVDCDGEEGQSSAVQTRQEGIFKELTSYVISSKDEKLQNSFRYQMLVKKKKTVLEYWLFDGEQWPLLRTIALKVFSMSSSSSSTAASQRNFSSIRSACSRLCNSLSAESIEKLVYIKTNHSLLTGGGFKSKHLDYRSCDDDNDDEDVQDQINV